MAAIAISSDDDEFDFDIDDADLEHLDAVAQAVAEGKAVPTTKAPSAVLHQRNLYGGVIDSAPTSSTSTVAKVRAVKNWDRATFAKHGWSKKAAAAARSKKGKGKKKSYGSDEEAWDDDEEDVMEDDEEDIVMDPSYDPSKPMPPIKWQPDEAASKTFVYPVQADKPRRDYQYNIVRTALFQNALVSLPTGLGKTFIAACVMLNFYRWYPESRIIFMAPTRPLVAQQIAACHFIAGIDPAHCVELTGQTIPGLRALAWATKRVIYSTPQTVENDLRKGRIDPTDISCIVIDEAHRASGDYAYCGVVRYLMSRNTHFRVLALTATPGSNGEAVQEVIDALHIGTIEVRTDQSIDIRKYIHEKKSELLVVHLGPKITSIRDRFASVMKPFMDPLLRSRLIWQSDPLLIHSFSVQQAYPKIKQLPGGSRANGGMYGNLKIVGAMARALDYLVTHSLTSFADSLEGLMEEKKLANDHTMQELVKEIKEIKRTPGYVGHPKMDKMRSMIVEHFDKVKAEAEEKGEQAPETRVMVFCNFRAVVEEIVDCLNQQAPTVKATPFVGQGAAKGRKGKTQKEQLETVRRFKKGDFNVLVATSIGEEGLDIGEIDLILCYEASKSPIRMLQRIGRTGRAREGRIIVLSSEGKEEQNWSKAKDSYNEVQNAIVSNKVFELYVDGERMLPAHVKPEPDFVSITAGPFDKDQMLMSVQNRISRKNTAEAKKPKKDAKRNMPNDAFAGFRTAGQLAADLKKQKSMSQEVRERETAALLTPEEMAFLRTKWGTRDGASLHPAAFHASFLPYPPTARRQQYQVRHSGRHNQLVDFFATSAVVTADLDKWHNDMYPQYRADLVLPWVTDKQKKRPAAGEREFLRPHAPIPAPSLPPPTLPSGFVSASVLYDRPRSQLPVDSPPRRASSSGGPARQGNSSSSKSAEPIVLDSSDEDEPVQVVEKPPTAARKPSPSFDFFDDELDLDAVEDPALAVKDAPAPSSNVRRHAAPEVSIDYSQLLDDDLGSFDEFGAGPSKAQERAPSRIPDSMEDDEVVLVAESRSSGPGARTKLQPKAPAPRPPASTDPDFFADFDLDEEAVLACDAAAQEQDRKLMPPPQSTTKRPLTAAPVASTSTKPALASAPRVRTASIATTVDESPVVMPKGKAAKRRAIVNDSDDEAPVAPNDRSVDEGSSSAAETDDGSPDVAPKKRKRLKKQRLTNDAAAKNPLFDFEAVRSPSPGEKAKKRRKDDGSGTESEEYEEENTQDRMFIAGSDEENTEDSPQARFYLDSLKSQAPGFAGREMHRPGAYRMRFLPPRREQGSAASGSSNPRSDDRYSNDSFCVDDEEELVMATSSQ